PRGGEALRRLIIPVRGRFLSYPFSGAVALLPRRLPSLGPSGCAPLMTDRHRTGLTLTVALMLISIFLAQGWYFIRANSQTFDEGVHLTAGYSYWATGDFRLNPEHPPLIKLACALPAYLWYRIPFEPDAQRWAQARLGEDEAQWRISKD